MWPIRITDWREFRKIQMQFNEKFKAVRVSFLTKEAYMLCLWNASVPRLKKPKVNCKAKLDFPWNASVQRFLRH
jgi:hypothetical protein